MNRLLYLSQVMVFGFGLAGPGLAPGFGFSATFSLI